MKITKKKIIFGFLFFLILLLPIAETCGTHKHNSLCAMPPQRPGQHVCYPAEYKPLGVIIVENLLNKTIAIHYKKRVFCQ